MAEANYAGILINFDETDVIIYFNFAGILFESLQVFTKTKKPTMRFMMS